MKIQVPARDITVTVPGYEITVPDPIPVPIPVSPIPPVPTPNPTSNFFAPDCIWNKKLAANATVHPSSGAYVSEMTANLRNFGNPWINSMDNGFGVPVFFAKQGDPILPVFDTDANHASFANTAELKLGIRIPAGFKPTTGSDHHATIFDPVINKYYGFWLMEWKNNRWECRAKEILANYSTSDGTTNPAGGWNTATAAHITLPAGLIRKIDLASGVIPHALAFATPRCSPQAVYPARTSDGNFAGGFPMGIRFRFPLNIVINPGWTPLTRMMVTAIRDYGMILRDTTAGNNVAFYIEEYPGFSFSLHLAGKGLWDVIGKKAGNGEIPFNLLQAVA